jgi:hypothetical protein
VLAVETYWHVSTGAASSCGSLFRKWSFISVLATEIKGSAPLWGPSNLQELRVRCLCHHLDVTTASAASAALELALAAMATPRRLTVLVVLAVVFV